MENFALTSNKNEINGW